MGALRKLACNNESVTHIPKDIWKAHDNSMTPSPPLRAGFRISGPGVLALWRGINDLISAI